MNNKVICSNTIFNFERINLATTTMNRLKFLLAGLLVMINFFSFSQITNIYTNNQADFKKAKALFDNGQFGLAYPLLKSLDIELAQHPNEVDSYIREEVQCKLIVCQLSLIQPIAEQQALDFLSNSKNIQLTQLLSFYLGHYYYQLNDYESSLIYFREASFDQLNNEQIADAKFEMAYALFNQKQFQEAKELFAEICQLQSSKYNAQAFYYFGFISYFNKDYNAAFSAFSKVVDEVAYRNIVPYYLTEILYAQGKKEQAMLYGDSVLNNNDSLYYLSELQLLVGQLYFEKQDYFKAQQLLETYVNASNSVSKEVRYELSYCYYQTKSTAKAIEGFKSLSNERDSMGQSSMYLLGSLYLTVEDKPSARSAFQFCANNSSDKIQQRISKFNYAKLSYELGFQDIALSEIKNYLRDYPSSELDIEAKELLVSLLVRTNNFSDGLQAYESISSPSVVMQKAYPKLLYGRAVQLIADQQFAKADEYLTKTISASYAESVAAYAKFWKGELAYRQKKYPDAVKYLSEFLQKNPFPQDDINLPNCRYTLGYSLFQLQNYKSALAQFEAILSTIDKTATAFQQDVFVRSADCYYAMKDYNKALLMYEQLIKFGFGQADYALYQKAMIVGVKNSTDKISILKSLSTNYSKSNLLVDAQMEIAQTLIAEKDFSQAIPFLNDIISNADAARFHPAALYKLGLANYNIDNNEKSLAAFKQLVSLYPQSDETQDALTIVKDIYIEQGNPDGYIDLLKANSINMGKNEADSLTYVVAYKKFELGDFSGANLGFENYLSKYINGTYELQANYYNAVAYAKNKKNDGAIKAFSKVHQSGASPFYEDATIELARIYYFESKQYDSAKMYFEILHKTATDNEIQLESLRGLVRSYYQIKQYATADTAANELLSRTGISLDDKAIALLVLGKSQQLSNDCDAAIKTFKSLSLINKSVWGAEARYELANCHFRLNHLDAAEKSALSVIKETSSYDYWVTKSYILLGDIFMKQNDYFNAKATYESVYKNTIIDELRDESKRKFDEAINEEKKLQNNKK